MELVGKMGDCLLSFVLAAHEQCLAAYEPGVGEHWDVAAGAAALQKVADLRGLQVNLLGAVRSVSAFALERWVPEGVAAAERKGVSWMAYLPSLGLLLEEQFEVWGQAWPVVAAVASPMSDEV